MFREDGVSQGVGFDELGRATGSMGIAAGDANGDGLLDLFVTNFLAEANNMYMQRPDGSFDDRVQQTNLGHTGTNRVGWGAQFIDGELDGLPDLVIANGHLGEYISKLELPAKMATLYMKNVGDGRFVRLPGRQLGQYFQGRYLGRAVTRLDWNRDGREDLCITHVDYPVVLLANRTLNAGHYLAVLLRGVKSDREAIGTTVRISVDGKSFVRQLMAGDGFESSNQRRLVFGLAAADHVDGLTVYWPSGTEQTFGRLQADRELLFVEGRSKPYVLNPSAEQVGLSPEVGQGERN